MKQVAKLFVWIFGVVVLLIAALVITAVFLIRRPFPQTDGTILVAGLNEPVNIYRDEFGVPHIYAENEYDLFFAQGYTHAQDRFWQMEFWRHISTGRLSEIIGEPGIESDKFIRTMGWNRMAANALSFYEAEEPELMNLMNAYSDGVNAYINQNRETLSINYTILGLVNDTWEIEPWTPLDTIAWAIVMSDDLSGNWSGEIRRANMIKELGASTVANLEPFYPYDSRPVIAPTTEMSIEFEPEAEPEGKIRSVEPRAALISSRSSLDSAVSQTAVQWQNVSTKLIGQKPDLGYLGADAFAGSNNWVIGGQHTESGQPILANDPHLGIQMPAIWYEVGLHAPGWDVVGFSFAGVPGVIIGHNADIAWGVTNANPDVQDLFIEKINPSNPNQYEFKGEWRDMERIEEVIEVNGGEEVVLEVRTTHHGPIISEIVDDTTNLLAIQWTAHEPSRLFKSVILLNQAATYDDFYEALRFWDVPSQNFVYADVEGNIAYQMPGLIPIRSGRDGLVPVEGWTGENEWEGWIPYEQLPAIFNPEKGYIVTANHAIIDEDYPYYIDLYWADGDRGRRITDMIETIINAGGSISVADVADMQFDSYSLMAASYIPLFDGLSSEDAQVQAAIERLRGWDYQLRRDSVPAALFEIFRMQLANEVLSDDVGEDFVRPLSGGILFHQLAHNPDAIWWDDTTTTMTETQADILLQAVESTVAWFDENLGGDMNDWTWGKLHTGTFVSNPLGASGIGLIEGLVNLGPEPLDGGSETVNANSWSWGNPAAVTGHVSMRMIVDMADFESSLAVIPTGQSGHPTHPHYEDMFPLWQNGQYHPMLWSRERVETAVSDHLVLEPAE